MSLPDSMVLKTVPLISELYRGEFDYYVLVSRGTHSQAATFANIFQYNNLGKIVGEPLQKNALKFGEVIRTSFKKSSAVIISTVEYDEYSKAVDGVLVPDISIPYIASEYMQGGDPVLEKLIEIINTN